MISFNDILISLCADTSSSPLIWNFGFPRNLIDEEVGELTELLAA